jgi:hypothetical protein
MTNKERRLELILALSTECERLGMPEARIWSEPVFPDDPLLVVWVSDNGRRVRRVQEAERDEVLEFTFAFGRLGLENEVEDLMLQFRDSPSKAKLVARVIEAWIHVSQPRKEVEAWLDEVDGEINLDFARPRDWGEMEPADRVIGQALPY